MPEGISAKVEGARETAARLLSAQSKVRAELRAALGEIAGHAATVGKQAADVGASGNLAGHVEARSTRAGNWLVGTRGVAYAGVQAFGSRKGIGRSRATVLAPSQVSQWLPHAAEDANANLTRIDRLLDLVAAAASKGK